MTATPLHTAPKVMTPNITLSPFLTETLSGYCIVSEACGYPPFFRRGVIH